MPGHGSRPILPSVATLVPIDPALEAAEIRTALSSLTRSTWSGELALLELGAAGVTAIDPADWPMHYFELLGARVLREALRGTAGPTIGRRVFPLRADHVWDFTAIVHTAEQAPLADVPAMRTIIERHSGLGVVVALGMATGDDAAFRRWLSGFERGDGRRVMRAGLDPATAPAEFRCKTFKTVFFRSVGDLDAALVHAEVGEQRSSPDSAVEHRRLGLRAAARAKV